MCGVDCPYNHKLVFLFLCLCNRFRLFLKTCFQRGLDDYQLKIRNLLRNSKYRDIITPLPKGEFVFPELNLKLKTEPFIQEGKPYQWKPKPTQQQQKP